MKINKKSFERFMTYPYISVNKTIPGGNFGQIKSPNHDNVYIRGVNKIK